MTSRELDNLARIGKLKREHCQRASCKALYESARARLMDAARDDLRFDVAHNTAHELALKAMRMQGYRSDKPVSGISGLTARRICRLKSGGYRPRRTSAATWPNMKSTTVRRRIPNMKECDNCQERCELWRRSR
jgi:hypothetical protein